MYTHTRTEKKKQKPYSKVIIKAPNDAYRYGWDRVFKKKKPKK